MRLGRKEKRLRGLCPTVDKDLLKMIWYNVFTYYGGIFSGASLINEQKAHFIAGFAIHLIVIVTIFLWVNVNSEANDNNLRDLVFVVKYQSFCGLINY